jgi:hypothetical protein
MGHPLDDSLLGRLFRRHGKTLARFPVLFILVPALIIASFAAGFRYLVIDDDPDVIWVPPTADTSLQQTFFDAAFDPFFRVNQIMILLDDAYEPAGAANASAPFNSSLIPPGRRYYSNQTDIDRAAAGILTAEYMLAALDLQLAITAGNASDGTALADLCYRPIQGADCLVETPLDYFFSDPRALAGASAGEIQNATANRKVAAVAALHPSYDPGWTTIHTPMMPTVILGGTGCLRANVSGFAPSVCGGCGTYANSLVITFLLQASPDVADAGAQWEQDVFLPLAANWSYPGLRISYMAQRSVQDQIGLLGSQNEMTVALSYALMFVYITLALGKFPHPVFTRALLGLQGILIVILSCVGAIGICAWCGLHITMIVSEVVPFLILALGACGLCCAVPCMRLCCACAVRVLCCACAVLCSASSGPGSSPARHRRDASREQSAGRGSGPGVPPCADWLHRIPPVLLPSPRFLFRSLALPRRRGQRVYPHQGVRSALVGAVPRPIRPHAAPPWLYSSRSGRLHVPLAAGCAARHHTGAGPWQRRQPAAAWGPRCQAPAGGRCCRCGPCSGQRGRRRARVPR